MPDASFKVGEAPWEKSSKSPGTFAVGSAPWELGQNNVQPDTLGQGIAHAAVDTGRWAGSTFMSIVNSLANPALRMVSNIRATADIAMGKTPQESYGYGPFGDASVIKGPLDKGGASNIWDSAGVGLDLASFMIPLGEGVKVAEEAGGQAAKGLLEKGAKAVVEHPKTTFSSIMGGSAFAKAKSEGKGTGEAVGQGLVTGGVTLGTLGLMDSAGNVLSDFGKKLSSTKSGQILSQKMNDIMEGLTSSVSKEVMQKNADTFVRGINSASEKIGNFMKSAFDSVLNKSGMLKQYDENGVRNIISDSFQNQKITRMPITQAFSDVFKSGFKVFSTDAKDFFTSFDDILGKADEISGKQKGDLQTQYQNILKTDGRDAANKFIQDYTKTSVNSTMAPALHHYIDAIKELVYDPLKSGKPVGVDVLDNLLHFITPNGNPTEQAIGKRLQDSVYNMFGDAMKTKAPELSSKWVDARESFRQLGNTLDKKMVTIFGDVNNMQQVADKFMKGDLVPTSSDVKELQSMIGNQGMSSLQQSIIRRTFESAAAEYRTIVKSGTPSTVEKAGQAAAKVFDSIINKAEKASGDEGKLLTSSQVEFLHQARNFFGGDTWSAVKNAAGEMTKSVKESGGKIEEDGKMVLSGAKQLYETMTRGGKLADVAKNPTEFATQVSKMAVEDLKTVKQLYSPEQWDTVGANILKNIATKSKSLFQNGADEQTAQKFITSLGSLGGENRDVIFKEIFGGNPTVETGVKSLIDAVDKMKTLEGGDSSVAKGIAHGLGSFIFAVSHHPIMAFGQAKEAMGEFANKEASEIEKELFSQLEKDGKIQPSVFRKIVNSLGALLKTRSAQTVVGKEASNITQ